MPVLLSFSYCLSAPPIPNIIAIIGIIINNLTAVLVSLQNAYAIVTFKGGNTYFYSKVSRRAIVALKMSSTMSLGFWVQSLVRDSVQQFNDEVSSQGRLSYKLIGATYNSKQALQLA